MEIDEMPGCCGITIMYDLGASPQHCLNQLAEYLYDDGSYEDFVPNPAFITWSDIQGSTGGKIASILRRKFGPAGLTRSVVRKNPGTGNRIEMFIWSVPKITKCVLSKLSPGFDFNEDDD